MFEVFQNPEMFHSATSHLPIALAILGIPLVLLSLILTKSHTARSIAIIAYIALMFTAWLATEAGEKVEGNVPYDAPTAVVEELDSHEWLAERIWIGGAIVAGLMLISIVPHELTRRLSVTLALLASVALAGWVAKTAHHGGRLVYIYGIGTPNNVTTGSGEPTDPVEPPPTNTNTGGNTDDDDDDDDDDDGDDNTNNSGGSTPPPPTDPDGPIEVDADAFTNPAHPFAARYTLQIRPLLEARCFSCHNPRRRGGPKGGLDLTTIEALMKGGETGPIVIPGNAEESLLILAVTYEDPFLQMPPLEEDRLSPNEIDILRNWINSAKPKAPPIGP